MMLLLVIYGFETIGQQLVQCPSSITVVTLKNTFEAGSLWFPELGFGVLAMPQLFVAI